ncbi:MAG: CoA transferase, partial [Gammaproteobacteria bacterium]|nr:CoA transferase [Gammaproteobacteria bacterium]
VNTLEQVFNHPQIMHREMVKQVPDINGTQIDTVASPINLSETPLQYISASPELGQHTQQVLNDQLGYNAKVINRLFEKSIIG